MFANARSWRMMPLTVTASASLVAALSDLSSFGLAADETPGAAADAIAETATAARSTRFKVIPPSTLTCAGPLSRRSDASIAAQPEGQTTSPLKCCPITATGRQSGPRTDHFAEQERSGALRHYGQQAPAPLSVAGAPSRPGTV